MPRRRHLSDIITRHQVWLERLKSHHVRDLAPAMLRLDRAMGEIVAKLGDKDIGVIGKGRLNQLLAEMREVQLDILTKAIGDLLPKLEEIAGYEAEFEAKAIAQAVRKVKLHLPSAAQAYRAAQAQPLSATGELLEPFLKDWAAKESKAVNNLIRKGYADGWTNQQLTQALRGTRKNRYTDGIMARIGSNADAVVRTSIQHVASTSRFEVWAANSDIIEGYRIVATLDGDTTQICRSLDGQVFKLGKGPIPPFHIRCRTTTIAEVSDEFDFLDEGATRSSQDGYVDAKETYYSWLTKQPSAFQDSAIGPVRGKLLRDGGLSAEEFRRLNLGRNFEPLTLSEMRKLEPKAFERADL